MSSFEAIQPQNFELKDRYKRISQRDIFPQSVKNMQLAGNIIKNTVATQEDSVSLGIGAQLNVTSTIASTVNDEVIIATVPFMIAFFESSLVVGNHIPFGANVDNDVYRQTGPEAVPQLTIVGHNGFNVVYKTALFNNTGGSKDIIVVTQVRFITGGGDVA